MSSCKRWVLGFLLVWILLLSVFGGFTVLIDPFFHYHEPLEGLQYPINNERYQNDGIVKHFDYDAIITGSSMTENFKTSEFDQLFGCNSIKVPYSGGTFKEVNDNLATALKYNPDVKLILRVVDYSSFEMDKDSMFEDIIGSFPYYLYDNLIFNDVEYIFNKTVFFNASCNVLEYTREGGMTTSFDEYSNWNDEAVFGKEAVDSIYQRIDRNPEMMPVTEEDYAVIRENISQNFTDLIAQHPDVQFYLFFAPHSIYYWDAQYLHGTIEKQLAEEKYVIELLLEYDNVHLFSFLNEYDIVCNIDNYMDVWHYNEDINSQLLVWMSEGEHELTKDNYLEYCEEMHDFYMNYDYDALFE